MKTKTKSERKCVEVVSSTAARSHASGCKLMHFSPTWMVNVQTLKDIDYAGYTERLEPRVHLNNVSSLNALVD
jgi:hypothetical protein